jgi:hypothetical protein
VILRGVRRGLDEERVIARRAEERTDLPERRNETGGVVARDVVDSMIAPEAS